MYVVIGSGPSGVAAARALVDRGLEVTMLDVGEVLEPERLALAHRMAALPRESWSEADVAALTGPSYFGDGGRLKRAFGSTYPYALDEMRDWTQRGTRCVQSFAQGGLSNVWGASVLPFRDDDLVDWPAPSRALAAHYHAIGDMLGIAGVTDDLEALFPFYAPPAPALRSSSQAEALIARAAGSRQVLHEAGIMVGRSRLAVRTQTALGTAGCQYAGLCLTGCPHFAIWHAGLELAALRRRPGFFYRPRVIARRIESRDGREVVVHAQENGAEVSVSATRLLLAAGPISSTRLVIDSLAAHGRSFTLKYQPYFMLPLLAASDLAQPKRESIHTLAQAFVELLNARVSRWTVHLQVYGHNPLIDERVDHVTRWVWPFGRAVSRYASARVLAVQGYLHSAEAEGIRVAGTPGPRHARLTFESIQPSRPASVIGRVLDTLSAYGRLLGVRPIRRLAEIGLPGDGNHVGGAFPMRDHPGPFEADLTGQLGELPGVHLVDSSSLPSLPATTLTYAVMAHAHRIATAVAGLR